MGPYDDPDPTPGHPAAPLPAPAPSSGPGAFCAFTKGSERPPQTGMVLRDPASLSATPPRVHLSCPLSPQTAGGARAVQAAARREGGGV